MQKLNPIGTFIFFWSFIVLVVFLMYNMVIAIILVVFQEQQEKRKNLQSLVISNFMHSKDSHTNKIRQKNV